MSLLGDNKLVHALEAVNGLGPTIEQMVGVLVNMNETLVQTNIELSQMKVELQAVKASMTAAALQVDGAASTMADLAERVLPDS